MMRGGGQLIRKTSEEDRAMMKLVAALAADVQKYLYGEPKRSDPHYSCVSCGGSNVEMCYPAFIDANTDQVISIDTEAEPLSCYCGDCGGSVQLHQKDSGRTVKLSGRWDT